jgi:cytochrome c-type biogenesis protein CcmH
MTARKMLLLLLVAIGLLSTSASPPVWAAVSPSEQLADPVLEERARILGRELRCLVCQNQSIDDSDADLARDLRQVVRERLIAGDSNQAILDYLTDRYGAFVLLRPPVTKSTWALWFSPIALLMVAAATVLVWHRRQSDPEQPWTDGEQERLDEALTEGAIAKVDEAADNRTSAR